MISLSQGQSNGCGWDSDWGHMSETLVLVVIWVPHFCPLESGMTTLFFHTSYAWDEKTGRTKSGCAYLFLPPTQPPYMISMGFLTAWHSQGSWTSLQRLPSPKKSIPRGRKWKRSARQTIVKSDSCNSLMTKATRGPPRFKETDSLISMEGV